MKLIWTQPLRLITSSDTRCAQMVATSSVGGALDSASLRALSFPDRWTNDVGGVPADLDELLIALQRSTLGVCLTW